MARSAVKVKKVEMEGENLRSLFDRQREAFFARGIPTYGERMEAIWKILDMTERHGNDIAQAISKDFGNRSRHETEASDLLMTISAARFARRHLKSWTRDRKVISNIYSLPGKSRIMSQPLGVVGIVAPWNYPYSFVMMPAISALAAGNRVMAKPSEVTAHTTELMGNMISERFKEEEFAIVQGGPEVGRRFTSLPFDHLLFTGSTQVGREVAKAAAENLTPVTLELGGKSPAILDTTCHPYTAVDALLRGKLFNAGQTCIAVDHVFVPEQRLEMLLELLQAKGAAFHPTITDNPDVTSIINDRHYDRIMDLLKDAEKKGARVIRVQPEGERIPPESRKIPLTLLLDVTPDMRVMQEEIFGPLLPILTYRNLSLLIKELNEKDRPLAMYWFGRSNFNRDQVLERTWAGGMTVNDTLFHILQEHLPFGGVGTSGQGAHMGEAGFRAFSKEKPVFHQYKVNLAKTFNPPYTKLTDRILALTKWLA